jgi:hypothetical protein
MTRTISAIAAVSLGLLAGCQTPEQRQASWEWRQAHPIPQYFNPYAPPGQQNNPAYIPPLQPPQTSTTNCLGNGRMFQCTTTTPGSLFH